MPIDPTQLAQDKDFAAASQDDQIKYLSSQDPDFAKASPADQIGYLNHIKGVAAPAPAQQAPQSFGEQNFINPMAQTLADNVVGAGKSLARTLLPGPKTAAELKDATGLDLPNAQDPRLQPVNTAQKIGATAEDIGEFVAGDEALKAAGWGEKALKAAGIAEKYEKASPFVKAAIEHMMNAGRQGVVGAVQQGAKTGDVGAAATAGGTAAASNLVLGPVLGAAGKAAGLVKDAFTLPEAAADVKTIQPILHNGIKQVLSDAADEIGVAKPSGASFRDTAKELGDSVYGRSKAAFGQIDGATNGEFTNVDNKIKNLNLKMRMEAGVNDAADQLMGQQKQILEGKMSDLMEQAKAKGVQPSVIDAARADYKQSQALYDLDAQIKKTTLGTIKPGNQVTSVKGLYTRISNLQDSGRLEEAIGADKAKELLGHTENASNALDALTKQAQEVAEKTKQVKSNRRWAAGLGAGAVIGGTGAEAVHRVLK